MLKRVLVEDLATLPDGVRQHAEACNALGERLADFVNAQEAPADVVLNTLFNLYANAVVDFGQRAVAGPYLVRIGVQWSLEAGLAMPSPQSGAVH